MLHLIVVVSTQLEFRVEFFGLSTRAQEVDSKKDAKIDLALSGSDTLNQTLLISRRVKDIWSSENSRGFLEEC